MADEPTAPTDGVPSESTWTYPSRMCRLCFEDVAPTVTMYPPGLPPSMQHPVVEYKNDDEYGRLIKPCLCTGSMRYVHELCLQRQRTEGMRQDSSWKCPTCGHTFNFSRLRFEKLLASRGSVVLFTLLFLVIMMFILGFVADPIINIYVDPYDTLTTNDYWHAVEVNDIAEGRWSSWGLHFMKGLVSMGVVGFLKTLALNPWNWWNWRHTGMLGGRRRNSNRGQDNAVAISWIAVAIGVASASYLFYQWIQALVAYALVRIGERVVDTQLPGDDEDITPPPGWKSSVPPEETRKTEETGESYQTSPTTSTESFVLLRPDAEGVPPDSTQSTTQPLNTQSDDPVPHTLQEASAAGEFVNSNIATVHRQGWSFGNI